MSRNLTAVGKDTTWQRYNYQPTVNCTRTSTSRVAYKQQAKALIAASYNRDYSIILTQKFTK